MCITCDNIRRDLVDLGEDLEGFSACHFYGPYVVTAMFVTKKFTGEDDLLKLRDNLLSKKYKFKSIRKREIIGKHFVSIVELSDSRAAKVK